MKAKLNPTAWWSPSTVTPICEPTHFIINVDYVGELI